jgi:hypothetical protein
MNPTHIDIGHDLDAEWASYVVENNDRKTDFCQMQILSNTLYYIFQGMVVFDLIL